MLSALLALSSGQEHVWLCTRRYTEVPKVTWLPLVVLAALAMASSIFGILHPLEFAAAFAPRSITVCTTAIELANGPRATMRWVPGDRHLGTS